MTPSEIIDSYVLDVMARVPGKQRHDIGLELRAVLNDMLAERGGASDTATTLALLKEFGTPEVAAARYHQGGVVIIPASASRSFILYALGGVVLQWALSLMRLEDFPSLGSWWFKAGLGALWWPGFMVVAAIIASWLKQAHLYAPQWRPRAIDPDRINKPMLAAGLAASSIGAIAMTSFPAFAGSLPGVLPTVFSFDADFLRERAPFAPVLWLAGFVLDWTLYSAGRNSKRLYRLDVALQFGWIALLTWWIVGGKIFTASATDEATKFWLGVVIALILGTLAYGLWQRRARFRVPANVA